MATVVRQVDLGLKGRDVAATLGHQAVQRSHEGAIGSGLLAGVCSALVKKELSSTGSLSAAAGCMLIKEQMKPIVTGGVLLVGCVDEHIPRFQGRTRPRRIRRCRRICGHLVTSISKHC
jgi:hypothetical protein